AGRTRWCSAVRETNYSPSPPEEAGMPPPDSYQNLLANPVATVEVGAERFQARASSTAEPERSQLYAKMVEMMPGFAEYERKPSRTIPVLTLERIASAQQ